MLLAKIILIKKRLVVLIKITKRFNQNDRAFKKNELSPILIREVTHF